MLMSALQNGTTPKKDEDDPYGGFGTEEVAAPLQTEDLEYDEGFQAAIRTSHGRRPPGTAGGLTRGAPGTGRIGTATGMRGSTAMTAAGRPMTGMNDGVNRPMTGIRGAGFPGTASGGRSGVFDPLNQAARGTGGSPGLDTKKEETPEDKIKGLEKKVNELIEESCFASGRGEVKLALDRAKEASSKERSLIRLREQAGLSDSHNLDLTFSVLFNLANQYAANEMYTEALNTYQVITKNRMFNNAGRLKVNMGNIYFRLGQYAKAIKLYRMALDQVPNTHKRMRIKIMHNIGILFVKMGQYSDACTSFEWIMSEQPDFKTGLHLVLCYYSLGDKDRTKKGFQQMLEVPMENDDEDKYTSVSDDPLSNLILEVIKNDNLRKIERAKKHEAEHCILTAAKLISPMIEDSFSSGYNWCVDTIKMSQHSQLANDLEINKAVMFLRQKDFASAVETLKTFEKQETKVASTASTNLSFLYFLQGETEQAERYAELARTADSYNAAAFVNLGNCCFGKGDIEKGKELYQVALENDASCVEALFNLGLCNKKLGLHEEALEDFFKLHSIVRNHSEVVYQIASLYESLGEVDQAIEWYLQLLGLTPTDPVILQKMGAIFDAEGDKQQAYQYHFDSYRYFPSNLEVIDWLGSYFIEMQFSEKAIGYFERASLMQPDDVKWQLMIASCYRRSGNYHRALETYKTIHRRFPENIECLKFLVKICSDMGLKEAMEYAQELKKAERTRDLREQRVSSSRPGSRRSSSRTSLNSRTGSAISHDTGGVSSPLGSRQTSSRVGSRGSMPGSAVSAKSAQLRSNLLEEEDEEEFRPNAREVDSTYTDPLGPAPERPRTSAGNRGGNDDEFADEEIGDDLLPE